VILIGQIFKILFNWLIKLIMCITNDDIIPKISRIKKLLSNNK
jgi:hypothetical protein